MVSSEDVSHVPVRLELHDTDEYIKSAKDMHPIEPIHLVNIDGKYQPQQARPVYIENKADHYSPSYTSGGSHVEPVYHGPVAIPRDFSHGPEVKCTLNPFLSHFRSFNIVTKSNYLYEFIFCIIFLPCLFLHVFFLIGNSLCMFVCDNCVLLFSFHPLLVNIEL